MLGRLKQTQVAAAVALLIVPALAQAQEGGRFQVLIPYFEPRENAEEGFGRNASEDLREMMNALPTHVTLSERDIRDRARQFNMDIDELNCLYAIQLATQLNVPIVICANYTQGADRSFTVNASIRTIATSEEFALPAFTVPRNGREDAARQIFTQFDSYNTLIRSAAICTDYAASQQWESALRNCDESLAINPNAMSTRFLRARILFEMERLEEALQDYDRVLQLDPLNEDALQTAGYIATTLGDDERGRTYYRRYLEVNPGNEAIRLRIAFQMAEAGDPVGAMEFIQPGLDVDPNSVELLDQYGTFAFMAALDAQESHTASNPGAQGAAPAAMDFYKEAIAAYLKVFEQRGAEMPVDRLRNIVAAYMQLSDFASAVTMSERVFEIQADEASVWSMYADALQRENRLDDALAALDRLLELQPDHPSAALRKGNWLIGVQRLEEAVAALSSIATDQQRADNAASMVFNEAYTNGFQKENWAYSIRGMVAAKQIPNLSPAMVNQLTFWHGFSLFQQTSPLALAQDLAAAQASLPGFQEALRLLNASGSYGQSVNMDMATLIEGLETYIEIQEAIIRRGY